MFTAHENYAYLTCLVCSDITHSYTTEIRNGKRVDIEMHTPRIFAQCG